MITKRDFLDAEVLCQCLAGLSHVERSDGLGLLLIETSPLAVMRTHPMNQPLSLAGTPAASPVLRALIDRASENVSASLKFF